MLTALNRVDRLPLPKTAKAAGQKRHIALSFLTVSKPALAALALGLSLGIALPGTPAMAEGDATAGASVFGRCSACHQVGAGAANSRGPQLNGVIGRPIAGAAGYRYSDGLTQRSGQAWTPDLLRSYVTDPARFTGGRSPMPAQRLRPDQLDNVIAYLRSL